MDDHTQDAGLDAPLDVEAPDHSAHPGAATAGDEAAKEPTGEQDESIIGKLLRQGSDSLDSADIEEPKEQL